MKGDISLTQTALLHVVMSAIILALAFGMVESLKPKIKAETTDIMASRIGSATYMMDGLDEGETELDLDGEYGFTKENGDYYVNYTIDSPIIDILVETEKAEIDPVADPVKFNGETGFAEKICLEKEKNSDTSIKMGSCR